jgi:hypothetical protein
MALNYVETIGAVLVANGIFGFIVGSVYILYPKDRTYNHTK